MPGDLRGTFAKLDRAQEHLKSFEIAEAYFWHTDPYEVVPEAHPEFGDGTVLNISAMVSRADPIPITMQLLVGDFVHNLRSALDHLAHQLVLANGGTPDNHTAFPIVENQWIGPRGKRLKKPIQIRVAGGVHVDALTYIQRLQPYQRGQNAHRHPLAVLANLDNTDKHRLLLVLSQTFRGSQLHWGGRIGTTAFDFGPRTVKWIGLRELVVGTQVSNLGLSASVDPQPYMNMKATLTGRIAFAESEAPGLQPVTEVLSRLHQFVNGMVKVLGQFITP